MTTQAGKKELGRLPLQLSEHKKLASGLLTGNNGSDASRLRHPKVHCERSRAISRLASDTGVEACNWT